MYHTLNHQAYPHCPASGTGSNYRDWSGDAQFSQNITDRQTQTWSQGRVSTSSDDRLTQYNGLQQAPPSIQSNDCDIGQHISYSYWLPEQSNFRDVIYGDPSLPTVEAARSLSHQSWNEMNVCSKIDLERHPSEVVSGQTAAREHLVHDAPDLTSGHIDNLVRRHCPPGHVMEMFDDQTKKQFDDKTIQKFYQKFGVQSPDLFFYRQIVNNIECRCPFVDCTRPFFKGDECKAHVERNHSGIISSKEKVVCSAVSNEGSRCRPHNEVQGRHFLTHFRELHLNAHGKCPFCYIQVTRVPGYFKTHFATCKRLVNK